MMISMMLIDGTAMIPSAGFPWPRHTPVSFQSTLPRAASDSRKSTPSWLLPFHEFSHSIGLEETTGVGVSIPSQLTAASAR
jgi:hypothetical protein